MINLHKKTKMHDLSLCLRTDFRPIKSNELVGAVIDFFDEVHFTHFPVLENNLYIGCCSLNAIENLDSDKKIDYYKYILVDFHAKQNDTWIEVLDVASKNNSNTIPVLDVDKNYLGYYELSDIATIFGNTPFLKEIGHTLVVEKKIIDFSMGQLVQILESNGAKILGVFISSSTLSEVEITARIASGNINEIIQSLRRYEFEVLSSHQEDTFIANLQERSEYLEKYLSI